MKQASPKTILVVLSLILLLLFGFIIALVQATQSESANRWLITTASDAIDGLSISHVSGTLAEGLRFSLDYQDELVHLQLNDAHVILNNGCFWQLSLCVKSFDLQELLIDIFDSEETSAETDLPNLKTPIYLLIEEAYVHRFELRYDNQTVMSEQDVKFKGDWIHQRLKIKSLSSVNEFCTWKGKATIRFRDDYPLQGKVHCKGRIDMLESASVEVEGDLNSLDGKGEFHSALTLNKSLTPIHMQFAVNAKLLSENLPFLLQLEQTEPIIVPLQQVIGINQFQLNAEGSLDSIKLDARLIANSDPLPDPVSLALTGVVSANQFQVEELKAELENTRLTSKGVLNFTTDVAPIKLEWQGNSTLSEMDLSALDASWQGTAQGDISHQATFADDQLHAQLKLHNLVGNWAGYPWHALGNLDWKNDQLHIKNLTINQLDNLMQADGVWSPDNQTNIQAKLKLPSLNRLLPEAEGSLNADFNIAGNIALPNIKGKVTGENLSYEETQVESLNGSISFNSAQTALNKVDIHLKGIRYGDNVQGNANASMKGNLASHEIQLTAKDISKNNVSLSCQGTATLNNQAFSNYQANCKESQINLTHPHKHRDSAWMSWRLANEAQLSLDAKLNVQLSPFCFTAKSSTLCLDSGLAIEDSNIGDIELSINQAQTQWLQPWLPEPIKFTGAIDGQAQITDQLQRISAKLWSTNTLLTIQEQNRPPLEVHFDELTTKLNHHADTLQLDAALVSQQAGSSKATVIMEDQSLDGQIVFSQLQIHPFSKLLLENDSNSLSGKLKGDLKLGGTLTKPSLKGSLDISEGAITHSALPEHIKNIEIHLEAKEDYLAIFNGTFDVQNQQGTIEGKFGWQDQWWSEIQLKANRLAYKPDDNVTVYLSPDLRARISPTDIYLNGTVFIPEAQIYLRSLPEQAVTVSPDTEIIGGTNQSPTAQALHTDITLALGESVRFQGFGLETLLTGKMNIKQQPGTPVKAGGIIRLEKGSYQAYGQTLTIAEGDLVFIDDIENPLIRLSATRDRITDNVVVGVKVTGRANRPEISFFSIPDMNQQEQLHYLITGRAPNTEAGAESSLAAEAALAVALESRTGKFTQKAGDMLGIEQLTLSTGSTEDRSEVGISGYITPDLMVRYGMGMFEAVNTLTLNYRIRNNLYFEVISGKSNAFDLLWSFDRD